MKVAYKKLFKFFLKLSVSLALVAWLFFNTNWKEVGGYLKEISILEIAVYYFVLILGMIISSYKWKLLANFKNISLPFFDFFKLYLTGTFINNFMPSFIGGDTFKAYQIGKKEKKYKEAASTVIIDRVTGLLGAMILSFIFFVFNRDALTENEVIVGINTAIVGCLALVGIFFLVRKMPFWKGIAVILPEKVREFIQILNGFAEKGVLLRAFLYSFLFSFVGLATANYILFIALGAKIDILDYLSAIFLVSIVSSIPVSVNNIGIKEWAYITFFGFFGVSNSLIVAIALLGRILQMILSFTAFPIYLKEKK